MACRLIIDLSPPFSPALLPPEVYADLYKSYVSTYRALGFALMGRTNAPKSQPATPPPKDKAARPPFFFFFFFFFFFLLKIKKKPKLICKGQWIRHTEIL